MGGFVMMKAFLKITNPYLRPDGMGKRRWAKVTQTAHADMAEYWHKHILPRHFTPTARHSYRNKPRSKKYLDYKRKLASRGTPQQGRGPVQMGGQIDNVFTGAMMRQLVQNNTIRAYPTRATLTMFCPRYVTMRTLDAATRARGVEQGWTYGKGKSISKTAGTQPDKAAEVTAMTADDLKKVTEACQRSISKSTKNDSTPPILVNP